MSESMKLHEAMDLAEKAYNTPLRTVYVITRYSLSHMFQVYERNKSWVRAFTDREEAEEARGKFQNLVCKLQSLEMSANEYKKLIGADRPFATYEYSDLVNINENIIVNILFYDNQFEPIKDFVKFYEDSEATYSLDDHCYTDINIGFHVEEVEVS